MMKIIIIYDGVRFDIDCNDDYDDGDDAFDDGNVFDDDDDADTYYYTGHSIHFHGIFLKLFVT